MTTEEWKAGRVMSSDGQMERERLSCFLDGLMDGGREGGTAGWKNAN